MVALNPPKVDYVPLVEAIQRMKSVPLDCDSMLTARELGVNFGDHDLAALCSVYDRSVLMLTQAGR